MTRSDLAAKLWDLSCVAGMNQRYYEVLEADLSSVVISREVAMVAVVVCLFVLQVSKSKFMSLLVCMLALSTAVLHLGLTSVEVAELRLATGLRWHWSQVRADADALATSVAKLKSDPVPDWFLDRFTELHGRRILVMPIEPKVKNSLLKKCFEDECRSRGVAEFKIEDKKRGEN